MKKILCLTFISLTALNANAELCGTSKYFYVKDAKVSELIGKYYGATWMGVVMHKWFFKNGKELTLEEASSSPHCKKDCLSIYFNDEDEGVEIKKTAGIPKDFKCYALKTNQNEFYCVNAENVVEAECENS